VGREDERAALQAALAACWQGTGGFVLVSGDAGVGKTRLLGEVLAGWDGCVLRGSAALAASLDATAPPVDQVPLRLERVFAALPPFQQPVAMMQPPRDGTRWLVVEQAGRVHAFANNPLVATTTLFLDIAARVTSGGEMGLLGFAFHPAFPTDPRVYAFYSHTDAQGLVSRLSEFTSADGGRTADVSSERIVLTIRKPESNHNGGGIAFGPDGFLYAGIGDGGGANDQHGTIGNGQSETTLLGKMLRIDVSSGVGAFLYRIPVGNPFRGNPFCGACGSASQACPEIFAIGFRNPWRWSFDRRTRELWVADVGQAALEEVNRVVLGGNYGWRCLEGTRDTGLACGTSATPKSPPLAEYGRDGASVTGGYVYRGSAQPRLVGRYIFGDFVSGRLFNIPAEQQPSVRLTAGFPSNLNISSFGESVDGEVFVVDYNGALYRVAE
jgi:glucose/arabinose dehydrogenase